MPSHILEITCIDPSGDFSDKGKGNTGFAVIIIDTLTKKLISIKAKTIKAKDFKDKNSYYKKIINHIEVTQNIKNDNTKILIIENYKQRSSSSTTETSELIGLIEYQFPSIFRQEPSEIKQDRYSDAVLVQNGVLIKDKVGYKLTDGTQTTDHARDAIRHGFRWINKNYRIAYAEMRGEHED